MSLLLTIVLLVGGGILAVFLVIALVVALWKAVVAILENVFNFLFKSAWGILMLVVFFWALFHFFPHNIHIK